MSNYKLVNPYIVGSLKTDFTASSDLEAGQQAWESITSVVVKNVPKCPFTLRKNGGYVHFLAEEGINPETKSAEYSVSIIEPNIAPATMSKLSKKIQKIEKTHNKKIGGSKHKEEDDDSSDSDDETYNTLKHIKNKQLSMPIVYYWYTPFIYDYVDVYIPTFITPIAPYIHINNLNSAYMG